jgi:hypothetical protein
MVSSELINTALRLKLMCVVRFYERESGFPEGERGKIGKGREADHSLQTM